MLSNPLDGQIDKRRIAKPLDPVWLGVVTEI